MAKIIKLNKTDDIQSVIRQIKYLKEKDVIFELEKGSALLNSSSNLRLMRKTGEAYGKKIRVQTNDKLGQMIATKAGVLAGMENSNLEPVVRMREMMRKSADFSDIRSRGAAVSKKLRSIPSMIALPTIGKKKKKSRFSNNFSRIFVFSLVVLVLAVFGLAVLLPKAEVVVYARSEPVTRDIEIQVDRNQKSMDAENLIIPGKMIVREVSHTKNFQTTGTKSVGTKTTGSVTIYNFTKNTLTLKATTTTLIVDGKNYFFTRDATGIRPTGRIGSGSEQEVDKTTLTPPIPIVAENAGEEYNLAAATKFQIKNAALGNQDVYAMNDIALAGGKAEVIKILSQADLDKATAEITNELATKVEEELSNESNTNVKLLASGSSSEILASTANKNVNDEAADFDMTMIARITGLTFNEEDVVAIAIETINAVLSSDKYLLTDSKQEISYRFKTFESAQGKGTLAVHFETAVAYRVNEDNLAKILAGKSASEIKEILMTKPEIDRVDVKFSPFFVNKAPRFNGKIYIKSVLSEI